MKKYIIGKIEKIREWKNKVFKDWLWDLLIGCVLSLPVLLIDINILIIPFVVTITNQVYNKLFEPKDFALRMAIPIIIQIIQLFI
jgi:hypothetical protein